MDRYRVHRFRRSDVLRNPAGAFTKLRVLVDPQRATGVDHRAVFQFTGHQPVTMHLRNSVLVHVADQVANQNDQNDRTDQNNRRDTSPSTGQWIHSIARKRHYGSSMGTRWSTADIGQQTGKVALVTGANSGLGYCIAEQLALAGAEVWLACRSRAKAETAAQKIRAVARGTVEILDLDLGDLRSVTKAAHTFAAAQRPLHLLINNAGLMALDQSQTVDGFETQFGVNHLGHFALTAELYPLLDKTPGARIVSMASLGHRMGSMHFDDLMFTKKYDRWQVYFQSKLANLLYTFELNRRLQQRSSGVTALAAHPGIARTDLGSEGRSMTNKVVSVFSPVTTQSAARGAEPALRAATDPGARGGDYYGPKLMVAGHAVLETPSRAARDGAAAQRLWEMSEELTAHQFLQ